MSTQSNLPGRQPTQPDGSAQDAQRQGGSLGQNGQPGQPGQGGGQDADDAYGQPDPGQALPGHPDQGDQSGRMPERRKDDDADYDEKSDAASGKAFEADDDTPQQGGM